MHVTWLAGAAKLSARARTIWRGPLMAVFQPGEENAEGAQAMIGDGLFKHFAKPDVVLGQHVIPAPASEDFGSFGSEWHSPSVFWFVGGTDRDVCARAKAANRLNEPPVNHSPKFAPVIHSTPLCERASRH